MRFRIGVNVGDVMVKDEDIFGDGVNVAARLEGLVKGGEICVSRGVHDHLCHRDGMAFDDLGEQLVKNIAHPIRAFRLRTSEAASQKQVPSAEETAEVPELPSAPAEISGTVRRKRGRPRARALGQRQGGQSCRARILPRAVSGGHLHLARPNTA
jgi:Adenylate and Guanylate cyclase catalytic domain